MTSGIDNNFIYMSLEMKLPLSDKKLKIYKSFFYRMLIVVGLNIIFYIYHWQFALNLLGHLLAWMYRYFLGLNTLFDLPYFTDDLQGVTILGKACTYIELYAYIIPFLYDKGKSLLKNVLVIFIICCLVQVMNICRIFFSVWWRISYDVPRWLNHDLPDTLIWYPICIGIMLYGSFKMEPVSLKIENYN